MTNTIKRPDFFDTDFAEIEKRVMLAMAEGHEGIVDYPSLTGRLPECVDHLALQRIGDFTRKALSKK